MVARTKTTPEPAPAPAPIHDVHNQAGEVVFRAEQFLTRPTNVVEALAAVQADIGGIAKMTPAQRQALGLGGGGDRGVDYAYRGIDQIASQAQPLFGKYGLVLVPRVITVDRDHIEINNRPWVHMLIEVEYEINHASGTALTAVVWGEARDNSDKAMNKAMTSAFKNLLLRILCIGDPQDDTDNYKPTSDNPQYGAGDSAEPYVPHEGTVLFERVKLFAGTPTADRMRELAKDMGVRLTEAELVKNDDLRTAVIGLLDAAETKAAADEAQADTVPETLAERVESKTEEPA